MNQLGAPNPEHLRNLIWFEFACLLLQTNKQDEDQNFLTAFPAEQRVNKFIKLKNTFLQLRELSKSLTGEEPSIYSFEMDEISETEKAAQTMGRPH